tara:strand:- start:323 stop:577 length:255 start_codon:yes stop_codon:yes gene_type:complete
MTDKLIYQVDQMEEKLRRLHSELDVLNSQVTAVEKNLLVIKGEAAAVEHAVDSLTSSNGWILKITSAGFVAAFIGWIVAGGMAP